LASTSILSQFFIIFVHTLLQTIQGIFSSRVTIAVCQSIHHSSVTTAQAFVMSDINARFVVVATKISHLEKEL
jgi:chloramphenicol O-acetyltransferase